MVRERLPVRGLASAGRVLLAPTAAPAPLSFGDPTAVLAAIVPGTAAATEVVPLVAPGVAGVLRVLTAPLAPSALLGTTAPPVKNVRPRAVATDSATTVWPEMGVARAIWVGRGRRAVRAMRPLRGKTQRDLPACLDRVWIPAEVVDEWWA